ncbi:alpha/beta fold hydrolase [Pseudidiomarina woesei]|uniref:Homoserine acetyltransferase n=1 Tax=Pseudidiomarina woesei TaxID=1381080 RepID=A0A0K6H440_9GAMM|nr:alpha/beta fold hydrolase [Pseudidiomarina woesei]CUA85754.1 Homoserine acetyltransferase [Pseudidiomarina woesei]
MNRILRSKVAGGELVLSVVDGDLNSSAPRILVLGGISGDRDAINENGTGWWQGLADAINLDTYQLVQVDYAGGTGESEVSPLPTSIAEQAALISYALQQHSLLEFHAVVGGSYGGLVALELAQDKALNIERLAIIGAAHRPTAQAVMLRALQREFVRLGEAAQQPERGVQLARALAMLSYRSADGMDQFYPDPHDAVAYIESRGLRTVQRSLPRARQLFEVFGPALDSYRIEPYHIEQPTLLIGFDSDQLVPPSVLEEFADGLPDCRGCHIFASSYGHDGFIKNTTAYAATLSHFLEQSCH